MAEPSGIWPGEHLFLLMTKAPPEKKQRFIDDFNKSIGFDVQSVREWKNPDRLQCPHCGPNHRPEVVCNGKIKPGSDRQRYLCRLCGASFNDYTGTVFHKSKKVANWPAFLKCMLDGKSIRQSAKEIGISPTTAHAWRKKILSHISNKMTTSLSGIVEYTELSVKTSKKGQKTGRSSVPRQKETLVFCISRSGKVYVGLGAQFVQNSVLRRERIFWCTDLTNPTMLSMQQMPAFSRAELKLLRTEHVKAIAKRFVNRYADMRGVASRYLPQYAAWHQFQDQNYHCTHSEKIRQLFRIGL
ncbi:IS1 family transposase [Cohnella pontilimi]|uniref:IS1 family transposase n=1 Tax=Cohnella pontilimi TaxID=2564100 RepID=A0A4U0FBK4_9BACL|nr:IS1 family transposase [Cohnella pontilimi]TJY42233.1 IS1 family transposase [Cohnella pontilimi]